MGRITYCAVHMRIVGVLFKNRIRIMHICTIQSLLVTSYIINYAHLTEYVKGG